MSGIYANIYPDAFASSGTWERDAYERLVEDTDSETALEILKAFLENLRSAMAGAPGWLERKEAESIARAAHKLRPTAYSLGFRLFSEICTSLDDHLQDQKSLAGREQEIAQWLSLGNGILKCVD